MSEYLVLRVGAWLGCALGMVKKGSRAGLDRIGMVGTWL